MSTVLTSPPRHSDFLFSLPTSQLPFSAKEFTLDSLTPAERIHLVHGYMTSMPTDGGVGIVPLSKDWIRVESVVALHDRNSPRGGFTVGRRGSSRMSRSRNCETNSAILSPSISRSYQHTPKLSYSPIPLYSQSRLLFPQSSYSHVYSTLLPPLVHHLHRMMVHP